MPLYEYQCEACAHRFEVIQKFSDSPVDSCPNCAGPVRKLISSPAIQFRGSGWYVTDYAKKADSRGAGSDGDTAKTADTATPAESGSKDAGDSAPATSESTPKPAAGESATPATPKAAG